MKHADLIVNCAWPSLLYYFIIYYIKLKSRLSVRLSDRHAGISAVSASIETGLAPMATSSLL